MKLYTAQCFDRHIDPVIKVFDSPDKAISFAKDFVDKNARHQDSIEELDYPDWIYYCSYSCEGDYVCVEETELNNQEH